MRSVNFDQTCRVRGETLTTQIISIIKEEDGPIFAATGALQCSTVTYIPAAEPGFHIRL